MFKKILWVVALVALISIGIVIIPVFPNLLGVAGAIIDLAIWILIVAFGFLVIRMIWNPRWISKAISYTFGIGACILVAALIFGIGLKNIPNVATPETAIAAPAATTASATTTVAPTATPVATVAPTATATSAPIETAQIISEGIDQPSKSWFLAKKGSVISGDVCIYDGDNNSRKRPLYDSKEKTADILVLAHDTYIWTEWGCYYIEVPTQEDVVALINDKISEGMTVRYFPTLQKVAKATKITFTAEISLADLK